MFGLSERFYIYRFWLLSRVCTFPISKTAGLSNFSAVALGVGAVGGNRLWSAAASGEELKIRDLEVMTGNLSVWCVAPFICQLRASQSVFSCQSSTTQLSFARVSREIFHLSRLSGFGCRIAVALFAFQSSVDFRNERRASQLASDLYTPLPLGAMLLSDTAIAVVDIAVSCFYNGHL